MRRTRGRGPTPHARRRGRFRARRSGRSRRRARPSTARATTAGSPPRSTVGTAIVTRVYSCSGAGYTPDSTSSRNALAASSSVWPMLAYCSTNFGMRPRVNPAQSLHTSSWPSQCGPAPTEIVGIVSSAVTLPAISDGTISSTTANAPASSTAWASSSSGCARVAAALDDVAAEAVLALRGEPDVGHHRDAGAHDALDLLRAADAAFQLHRVAAGLLHEPDRRVERLARGRSRTSRTACRRSRTPGSRRARRRAVSGISSSTVTGMVVS